jgi:Coenzyme PQQ synthesis protein D (PqqD)
MPATQNSTSSLTSARCIAPQRHVVYVHHGDAMVLLDVRGSRYYSLNDVGGHVWTLLERYHTVSQIVDQLAVDYPVSRERLESDTLALLSQLHTASLVTVE